MSLIVEQSGKVILTPFYNQKSTDKQRYVMPDYRKSILLALSQHPVIEIRDEGLLLSYRLTRNIDNYLAFFQQLASIFAVQDTMFTKSYFDQRVKLISSEKTDNGEKKIWQLTYDTGSLTYSHINTHDSLLLANIVVNDLSDGDMNEFLRSISNYLQKMYAYPVLMKAVTFKNESEGKTYLSIQAPCLAMPGQLESKALAKMLSDGIRSIQGFENSNFKFYFKSDSMTLNNDVVFFADQQTQEIGLEMIYESLADQALIGN